MKGIVAAILSLGMLMAGSLASFAAELPRQRPEGAVSIESTAGQASYADPGHEGVPRYIKGNGVRLRREPGDGEVVGLLYENAEAWVKLSGQFEEVDGKGWVRVTDSSIGHKGWISAEFLKSYPLGLFWAYKLSERERTQKTY